MPSDLRDLIRSTLDEPTPAALDRLFRSPDLLGWGKPTGLKGFPLDAEATTWAEPVALLGGVGVYRIDVAERPTLTTRRAHLRRVDGLHRGALLVYRMPEGALEFVYARAKEDGGTAEARSLAYDPGTPARTTLDRLAVLRFTLHDLGLTGDPGPIAVSDRLHDAFSVEAVSNAFFAEYRKAFERVREAVAGLSSDDERHAFTQRLFNRLLFLRFLEEKGWVRWPMAPAQDRRFLLHLWRDHATHDAESSWFYDARLRLVFFSGLNNHSGGTVHDPFAAELIHWIGLVPFLNGGLFDYTADGSDQRDGVSVPDEALASVLGSDDSLLYRYHFTVTESTPLDAEVGVDPEMLGRIFEELVNDRHDSGSYYTPKPIVAFMGREALRHFLETRCPTESPTALDAFVFQHDASGIARPEAVLDALRTVRVLDPACGSGAYLVGMLHELLDLRAALFASRGVDAATAFERKLETIEQSLYGVDLKPFAVSIAQLRLWLSLVVDDPRNPLDDPRADVALPNLTYRIETGDSLTAPPPTLDGFGGLEAHEAARLTADLARLKAEHLTAHGPTKRGLETAIADAEARLRSILALAPAPEGAFDWRVAFAEVFAPTAPLAGELPLGHQLAEAPTPGGFDIVVANPPYVRQELLGKPYKETRLRLVYPEAYSGTADLFVYFFARAHQLLRPGGVAAFIAPNKWLRAGYGEPLRQHLLDRQHVRLVVDFGDAPVFQAAIAYPAIYVWQKAPRNGHATRFATVKDLDACYADGVRAHVYVRADDLPAAQFGAGKPRIVAKAAADRLLTMQRAGVPLSENNCSEMYRGVTTGLNEAFIVDQATRDRLEEEDPRSAEILKPLLAGDDVRAYETHFRDQYLIFTRRGTDISAYPAIERHLSRFREDLTPKTSPSQKKGRKPGPYKWFEIQDNVAYHEAFERPKLLWPQIGLSAKFTIDPAGYYTNNKLYFLSGADFYLLGVLNAATMQEWVVSKFSPLQNGYYEFISANMLNVPIPEASSSDREAVAALAQQTHGLHGMRRARVERFLYDLGTSPAQSSIRSVLESPWAHDVAALAKKAKGLPGLTDRLLVDVRDETAALTERIARIETEINARVAALYGL